PTAVNCGSACDLRRELRSRCAFTRYRSRQLPSANEKARVAPVAPRAESETTSKARSARIQLRRRHYLGGPFVSGNGFPDQAANFLFRRRIQPGEGRIDGVHVGALVPRGVYHLTEAEHDEVFVRLDVANVLAVLHIERQPPAHDRLERRRILPDDGVQSLSDLPIRCWSLADLSEYGRVASFREHISLLLDCRFRPRSGFHPPYRHVQNTPSTLATALVYRPGPEPTRFS